MSKSSNTVDIRTILWETRSEFTCAQTLNDTARNVYGVCSCILHSLSLFQLMH